MTTLYYAIDTNNNNNNRRAFKISLFVRCYRATVGDQHLEIVYQIVIDNEMF
jgi:hypothetical protein